MQRAYVRKLEVVIPLDNTHCSFKNAYITVNYGGMLVEDIEGEVDAAIKNIGDQLKPDQSKTAKPTEEEPDNFE